MTGGRSRSSDVRAIVGHTQCKVDLMEMHQIRYFLALSNELNFTRAAKRCGVSQPSLTNAINALERQLGGALFRRRPQVALTALGSAIEPYLRQIAQTADDARKTAERLAGVPRPSPSILSSLQESGSP
jgi:DNA-binding transcriptional LysR family regulator